MAKVELGRGKFIKLVSVDGWEYCERVIGSGVTVIIPVLKDAIILIDQYRRAVAKKVIELPAGLVGDHAGHEAEDFSIAAARELEEETGYRAGKIEFLFEGPTSSGLTSETVNFYLASDLVKVGPGGGDATENIQVHVVPFASVDTWLEARADEGFIIDPKIYTGLYFARRDAIR